MWGGVLLSFLLLCGSRAGADASDHRYREKDLVPLYANKAGPFHNPSETYRYYDLPFCSPGRVTEKRETLGEVLYGDRLVDGPYELRFREDLQPKTICSKKLTREEVAMLRDAVSRDYSFQMYYDDLPFWGFLGKVEQEFFEYGPAGFKYLLHNHFHFDILYNGDQVIEINVNSVPKLSLGITEVINFNVQRNPTSSVDITEDKEMEVSFTYSASWKETGIPFGKRMDKYSMTSSLPPNLDIHWWSIINSCETLLILTVVLAVILIRVLRNNSIKYSLDEESAEAQELTGWKSIHGDVFRFPKHKSLFSAVLGSGTQLLALALSILLLALVGVFHPDDRGAFPTALVFIYALTSAIAGYTATSMYLQLEGTNWIRNLLLTGCLFSGPLLLTFCFLNTVAIAYGATAALPFGTILVVLLIWALLGLPLLVLGGVVAKSNRVEFQAPCRTMKVSREIPPLRWYRGAAPQMALAGFLALGTTLVEIYFAISGIWGREIYTTYSFLFIGFIMLMIVTAVLTAVLTYFQLAAEDHNWWWRSVLCGGSIGVFILLYSCHHYQEKTRMSGFMQTSFFFGSMSCISYAFFLMLGTVGFRAALLFVRLIYGSIKCD